MSTPLQDRRCQQWLEACKVIEQFLSEITPHHSPQMRTHNARAILARLVSHDPPLHVCYADEMKWEE